LKPSFPLPYDRPRRRLRSALVAKLLSDLDHAQARPRRIAALACAATARALLGLFHRLDGQDGIAERDVVLDRHVHQPVIGVVAHDIVVPGLAADDAAQRDGTGIFCVCSGKVAGRRGLPECERDLQRARHGKTLNAPARGLYLFDRAGHQIVADIVVEARLDDEDRSRAAIRGKGLRALRFRYHD
jgi:hypothetical protein